ncbi:hypothetical protein, partial [Staphylococcus felis]|uniref:hypothetical protein n=1 Tax=Staphylococcus felis TaxID=46127 RepID=UPI001EE86AB5
MINSSKFYTHFLILVINTIYLYIITSQNQAIHVGLLVHRKNPVQVLILAKLPITWKSLVIKDKTFSKKFIINAP